VTEELQEAIDVCRTIHLLFRARFPDGVRDVQNVEIRDFLEAINPLRNPLQDKGYILTFHTNRPCVKYQSQQYEVEI